MINALHVHYVLAIGLYYNLQKLEELGNIANVFLAHQLRRGEYGAQHLRRHCSQQLRATITTNMPADRREAKH